MKGFNKDNFFKYTYCEFQEVDFKSLPHEIAHYISKSKSQYYYTDKGVYRYSDHWGRVANCRWKLNSTSEFKSQQFHLGYASWGQFFKLDDTQKQFFITVDYNLLKVNFHHQATTDNKHFYFTASTAQQRVKKIRHLLQESKWAKHYDLPIEELRFQIISEFITSNASLSSLKMKYR